MASAFTHAFVAGSAGLAAGRRREPVRFWVALVVLSCLPDADSLGFSFGIPYADPLGHRGFFHSLLFAALVGTGAAFLLFRDGRFRRAILFSLVAASHGFLDAMTDGGLGIAFFSPLSNERFFLPFRPLAVAPISASAFFGEWGVRVLASEIVFVWIPVGAAALAARALRSLRR